MTQSAFSSRFAHVTRRGALQFGAAAGALGVLPFRPPLAHAATVSLLNVSYDVSREFYKDYNLLFAAWWKQQAPGDTLVLNQSHGGSSKQARNVVDGLEADVVTMNQPNDIDLLHDRGNLLTADWATRFPDRSAPTTSTTVILVRKGNPKAIRDWDDLGRPGVTVVLSNPKTSGNGRYAYLAAWGAALKKGANADAAQTLVRRMFKNVAVLDAGGRAATTTFAERGIGDALAAPESEVPLIRREFGDHFDVIYPSWCVLAENPVAVVDRVVDKRGTRRVAEAYLRHLWSDEAQELAARRHLRPRSPKVLAAHAGQLPPLRLFTVEEVFSGWRNAQRQHFDDGGVYDQIVASTRR